METPPFVRLPIPSAPCRCLTNLLSAPPPPYVMELPSGMRLYLPACHNRPPSGSWSSDDYANCTVPRKMAVLQNFRNARTVFRSVLFPQLLCPLARHGANPRIGPPVAFPTKILPGVRLLWLGLLDFQRYIPCARFPLDGETGLLRSWRKCDVRHVPRCY